MTVPIFPENTAVRSPHQAKPLQSFDVRCDWLSLIYRGPGSVNFKLTDKKSTATIRTHRFFFFFPSASSALFFFSSKNGNNTAVGRVLAGGHGRLVVWKLSSDYFSPSSFHSSCLFPVSNR
jgi:hypothetical protein